MVVGNYNSTLISLLGVLLASLVSGCISSRQLVYFQGQSVEDSTRLADRFVPTVQPGDILSVRVSSLSPEAASFFNPPSATMPTDRLLTPATITALPELSGYLVNADGTLELPLLGKVPVGGLTTAQLELFSTD